MEIGQNVRGPNHLLSRILIEGFARADVRQFFISPGSRSTPLVEAVAERQDAKTVVHFDERGAAFAALGFGRATGKPAVLICTSGTAVANYFPAVIEAFESEIPLIVLSADRPIEAVGTGANQTIAQAGIFGSFAIQSFDLDPNQLLQDHQQIVRITGEILKQSGSGPVQVNLRFRKPLLVPAQQISARLRWPAELRSPNRVVPLEHDREIVKTKLAESKRTLVVVGQLDQRIARPMLMKSLAKLGAPVFASVLSGLRQCETKDPAPVLCHYEFYLDSLDQAGIEAPDLILHLGRAQPSSALERFLENRKIPTIVIAPGKRRYDPQGTALRQIDCDPAEFLAEMELSGLNSDWAKSLWSLEQRAAHKLAGLGSKPEKINEWSLAVRLSRLLQKDQGIFLASSLPVREADACFSKLAPGLRLESNRGVSGIDGTIASAAGFCQGLSERVTVLIGDLALLHDLNSLSMLRELPVTVVAINNDGGGIFELLPIKQETKHFEKFWGTPHGLSFEAAASMFGLTYTSPQTLVAFESEYRESLARKGATIIEVRTSREETAAVFRFCSQLSISVA